MENNAEVNPRATNVMFLAICREAIESNKIITLIYEFDEEEIKYYKMSLYKKITMMISINIVLIKI